MGELFNTTYGRGVARGVGADLAAKHGPPVVIAHPEPWASLAPDFGVEPAALVMVEGLERPYLEVHGFGGMRLEELFDAVFEALVV